MIPLSDISRQIWDMKYRLRGADGQPADGEVEDTLRRVARAVAAAEAEPEPWASRFYGILESLEFLPAGRILAGAGTGRSVTLFNCFVMGVIEDSMASIFDHLREAALTMQQGGGIGYDFSTLRPKGAPVCGVGADASGPLSFMDVWDAMCRTVMSAGSRRGAMMGTLRCDHPDIEAFIDAKRDPGRLRMFNVSVLVTDAFMAAVEADADWDLVFEGTVYRTVRARSLWDRIMRATYDYAEPGVIFIDRINAANNLAYAETIRATNPCGEQPLPPYGACLLGSVNLARLVRDPFGPDARLDEERLAEIVPVAVRLMDDVIDVSGFPLEAQAHEARSKRRIGLGVTGLADAFAMLGVRYGSAESVDLAEAWLRRIQNLAYRASAELAAEKGAFPLYDAAAYLDRPMVKALDDDVRAAIARHGVRNALVTSVAPTGTISLFADNVSSGIEPIFAYAYTRAVLMPDGTRRTEEVTDHAVGLWRRMAGEGADLPDGFVEARRLAPRDHLAIQAAAQKWVDSSISKTINCPADLDFASFESVYREAYRLGCKGCTTYRPNPVTGSVLDWGEAPTADAGETPTQASSAADADPGAAAAAGERSPPAAAPASGGAEAPVRREPGTGSVTGSVTGAGAAAGEVVYMTQPLDRPGSLPGRTYKLKWPESDHALYVTINDIEQDGRRRPFEVFINSKNMEHFAWTVALTRMISAVFRRGGDVSFVVEELKSVFDPRGGYWQQGRYVPSLLAAIGEVIERHMTDIGFLPVETGEDGPAERKRLAAAVPGAGDAPGRPCPRCATPSLIRQEDCDLCLNCGYSRCA